MLPWSKHLFKNKHDSEVDTRQVEERNRFKRLYEMRSAFKKEKSFDGKRKKRKDDFSSLTGKIPQLSHANRIFSDTQKEETPRKKSKKSGQDIQWDFFDARSGGKMAHGIGTHPHPRRSWKNFFLFSYLSFFRLDTRTKTWANASVEKILDQLATGRQQTAQRGDRGWE